MNMMKKALLGMLPILALNMMPVTLSASAESGTLGDGITWTIEEDVLTLHGNTFNVVYNSSDIQITGTDYTGIVISEDVLAAEENQPLSEYLDNFGKDSFFTWLTVSFDVEKISNGTVPLDERIAFMELTDTVTEAEAGSLAAFSNALFVIVQSRSLILDGTELEIDSETDGWNFEIEKGKLLGYEDSPAQIYAEKNGLIFIPLEGSGTLDDEELYQWKVKDDILTISANDESFKVEYLPDEVLVSGTSFTLSRVWANPKNDEENLYAIPLMNFWKKWNEKENNHKWVFDVEDVDSIYACYGYEAISELVLTENVQHICQGGLYTFGNVTDVYVESDCLDLKDSLLGCDNIGSPVDSNLKIHGYTDSPAQAYAAEYGFTFVALDEPETTEPMPETTDSITKPTSETTSEETSTAETTASTTNNTNTTPTTSNTTIVSSGTSSPNTGEGGIAAVLVTGVTALLGGLVCRKKK